MQIVKRLTHVLIIVLTLVVGAAAAAIIVSQTAWFKNWLRGFIVAQANNYLNGTLSIERLGGNLFFGVEMENIGVSMDGSQVVAVKDLGLKYNFSKDFDITGAWYGYDQNAFGATKCSDNHAGNCSGNEDVWSLRLDYRFTKRFDVYAGGAWSKVEDGLSAGFLHTSTTTVMAGFRFNF